MTTSSKKTLEEVGQVETCVGRLFVESHGTGSVWLFWPSLLADSGIWQPQVEALSRTNRLLLVDGPGHGRSGPPLQRPSLDVCTTAMEEVLDHFEVEQVVVVGLAWGAMLGLRLALRASHRVRGLALINVTAEGPTLARRLTAYKLLFVLPRLRGSRFFRGRLAANLLGTPDHGAAHERFEALLDRIQSWDRPALQEAVAGTMLDSQSIIEALGQITCPTWVLVGSKDRAIPPENGIRVARAIPGARLERLPNAGHLAPLDAPAGVTQFLLTMLASLPR